MFQYNLVYCFMQSADTHKVVLYNDDTNTFEYVMACLIKMCNHNPIQAEQCALIVHNNGKCTIKHGSFDDMYELNSELNFLSLKTELEVNESSLH